MVDPNKNWIKLNRSLINNEMWCNEPFTRGQAWVDLLMLANYEEGHIRVRGNRVDLARGQVGWSQEKLALRWKWSRKKVSNFLKELEESEQQIAQHKNNVSSVITIVNYEKYQQREQQKAQHENGKGPAEEPQGNTNKNNQERKKVKNEEKEPKSSRFTPPSIEEVKAYFQEINAFDESVEFFHHHETRDWKLKSGQKMAKWKSAVATWISNDFKGNQKAHRDRNKPEGELARMMREEREARENRRLQLIQGGR